MPGAGAPFAPPPLHATARDPIFSDSRDPMITFSDSRNPIFNSRDPIRVPETP